MASKNKLLGSGIEYKDEEVVEQPKTSTNSFDVPCWMYSVGCREGKIITSSDELKKLKAEGWVDHPGKVFLLPGFEKMYEEYNTKKEEPTAKVKPTIAGMKVSR